MNLDTFKNKKMDELLEYYQELFNHMDNSHDLILSQDEMDEIIIIVNKMNKRQDNPCFLKTLNRLDKEILKNKNYYIRKGPN